MLPGQVRRCYKARLSHLCCTYCIQLSHPDSLRQCLFYQRASWRKHINSVSCHLHFKFSWGLFPPQTGQPVVFPDQHRTENNIGVIDTLTMTHSFFLFSLSLAHSFLSMKKEDAEPRCRSLPGCSARTHLSSCQT